MQVKRRNNKTGILDQLLEKKDLNIYLDLRIEHLKRIDITKFPEKDRGYLAERLKGRIRELALLKKLLFHNQIKDADKSYWNNLFKTDDDDALVDGD